MKIQVFGSGCPTCKKLYEKVKIAVAENGLAIEIEYTTNISKMVEMGIMQSPALVINDKIVVAGRVPSAEELKEIIAKYKK
jgi:small redox-active disulfide protein 2